jgi:hypothetical protein
MRKVKIIPNLVEVCKRVTLCDKKEIKDLGFVLSDVIQIIHWFSSTRENRNYMY